MGGTEGRAEGREGSALPLGGVLSENRALIGWKSHRFQGEPPDLPGPFPGLYVEDTSTCLINNAREALGTAGCCGLQGGVPWGTRLWQLLVLFSRGYTSPITTLWGPHPHTSVSSLWSFS